MPQFAKLAYGKKNNDLAGKHNTYFNVNTTRNTTPSLNITFHLMLKC